MEEGRGREDRKSTLGGGQSPDLKGRRQDVRKDRQIPASNWDGWLPATIVKELGILRTMFNIARKQ